MRLALIALMLATPAFAHHPEERLDDVMAEKEPAFEATDTWRVPRLDLIDTSGRALRLEDMHDRIVVLSLTSEACGAPCAAQQTLLDRVWQAIDATPMRDMVTFVHVQAPGTEFSAAAPNRIAATPAEGDVSTLAADLARLSAEDGDAPLVHVIDRNGRHAGVFHGDGFGHVNAVLYINGLSNARPVEPGFMDRMRGVLR